MPIWLPPLPLPTTISASPVCAPAQPPWRLCVAEDGLDDLGFPPMQFLANMNAAAYLGQSNWQAPTSDSTCTGYSCSGDLKTQWAISSTASWRLLQRSSRLMPQCLPP